MRYHTMHVNDAFSQRDPVLMAFDMTTFNRRAAGASFTFVPPSKKYVEFQCQGEKPVFFSSIKYGQKEEILSEKH